MKGIVLLGAPGAGKGTQAKLIAGRYSLPHISTGDILRSNIKEGTQLGRLAKSYIDEGRLVPDEVVVAIVRDRLAKPDCENGFLLDGFPRTTAQAEELDKFARVTHAVDIEVDPAEVVKRIAGRRMCRCGESYHISSHSSPYCDKCGAELYQRDDDKEETVAKRLEVYAEQTAPLIGYYRDKGVLFGVNGMKSVDEVFAQIAEVLDGND